jgi:predicted transcriptional regulator
MEVHFTPEQEAQLSQIATQAGTDAERLVKDAALRLLQEDARFRAAVREGIAQADRGELIGEEEMDARLEQMLRSSMRISWTPTAAAELEHIRITSRSDIPTTAGRPCTSCTR